MKPKIFIRFLSVVFFLSAAYFTACKDDKSNVKVKDISLNKTSLSLIVGDTETLIATITPENAVYKNTLNPQIEIQK